MKTLQYGPCGLYCGACGATDCGGCQSNDIDRTVEQCKFRRCSKEKNLEFCCFCSEYPCAELNKFMNDEWPHHWTMETNLECIKKHGKQEWLKVQNRHRRMLNLISILYDHLEKNSSIESLIDFKTMAKDEFRILSELLCGLFQGLSLENAAKFLNMQLAASIGLYTMTDLSEVQKKVLEHPEFEHFKVDYNTYLQETIRYLLQGLLSG